MKILYLIPARAGSKGVPGKNLKMLTPDGPTLLERAWMVARKCVKVTGGDVRISTDIKLPKESPLCQSVTNRPHWLCGDNCDMLDVVRHELTGNDYEILVLLQPTCPFRPVDAIVAGVNAVLDGKTTAVAVAEPRTHPAKLLTKDGCWAFPPLHPFANRQEWTEYNEQVGTFYVANADHLRNGGNWMTALDTQEIAVSDYHAINIDKEIDLLTAMTVAEVKGL